MSSTMPFTHAILDDEGEVIRKHRWSNKEAKWFTDTNKDAIVVKLPKQKIVEEFNYDELSKLCGESPF
jgi:hypothetical protein